MQKKIDVSVVGATIHRLRRLKGYTQAVLSSRASIARSHLSMIENGDKIPCLDTLFKIAYALDLTPHELVWEMEKDN